MLRRLIRNRRGSAAVEFAFIAPVAILFYYALVESSQGMLANRRAGHVATAVGDIVAQNGQTSSEEVEDIFDIASAIFRPLPTDTLSIRLTSIRIEANGQQTVVWSQTRGSMTGLSGVITSVPAPWIVPGSGVIRADTSYTYNSPLQKMMPEPIQMSHTMYIRPRGYVAVLRPN
ncbi:TadE/TadG family type IV pilus assembly protein [Phenylobacterium sp.]|uniref:TadE/TadG family type IV pilus assembly protein n=1 Tax=Phenylobacterium sp. TaxID=1871053 RepID=UPI002FC71A6E